MKMVDEESDYVDAAIVRGVVKCCPEVAFFGDLFCRGVLLIGNKAFELVCQSFGATGVELHLFGYCVFFC